MRGARTQPFQRGRPKSQVFATVKRGNFTFSHTDSHLIHCCGLILGVRGKGVLAKATGIHLQSFSSTHQPPAPRPRPYRYQADGKPICMRCNKAGHIARVCTAALPVTDTVCLVTPVYNSYWTKSSFQWTWKTILEILTLTICPKGYKRTTAARHLYHNIQKILVDLFCCR